MLLLFTILLSGYGVNAQSTQSPDGCTLSTVSQDIIFMIDYSGSICSSLTCCNMQTMTVYSCEYYDWARCCVNEWEQILTFAKTVVDTQLPEDSRVAAMGFGRNYDIEDGWYNLGDNQNVWKTVQQASDNIMNVDKVGGATYLGAGIEWLLEDSPIDWEADVDRKRILMVLTDGDANDGSTLCAQAPELLSRGIETVIVGITNDFKSETVQCLVADPASDIIEVDDWNNLEDYVSVAGTLTCEANQVWELTEVKAGGSVKYIEYINTAVAFDGNSIIRVSSNLLSSDLDITDAIPQSSRVVIGTENAAPSDCDVGNGCYYYKKSFSSAYTSETSKTDDWTVSISQVFMISGSEDATLLETVAWDATFPNLDSGDYSLELTSLGFDNTAGANWRRSCAMGGSFGSQNVKTCPPCSDDFECNPSGVPQNQWENTCGDTGCICASTYYNGNNTGSCLPIPVPQNCRFMVDEGRTESQEVVWEKAGDNVFGYKVLAGAQQGTQFSSHLSYTFQSTVDQDNTVVYAAAIGEYEIDNNGLYNPTRVSVTTTCAVTYYTSSPTQVPTAIPTVSPTEYQPLVFLGGFSMINDVIQPIVFTENQASLMEVDVRIYLSPPQSVPVHWILYDGTTQIETGIVTFPANALENLADTLPATLPNGLTVGNYTFELQATSDNLDNDPANRKLYELYSPSSIAVEVREAPVDQPTMAPTEYQPLALLGPSQVDNATGLPLPLTFQSNQNVDVTVRITPAPGFSIGVLYRVTEVSTGIVTESGEVTFPAFALNYQADIQIVTLVNCTLNTTADQNEWKFELLDTTEKIPDDPSNRRAYELYTPTEIDIIVERYVDNTFIQTETEKEEVLDWWLIMIICLVAAGIVVVVGWFGYGFYIKWKYEKEQREQVEEELAYEEDGIDGFYNRAGINNTQENPLHAKKVDNTGLQNQAMNAEMVMVDDDAPFSMNMQQNEYGQRQIEVDSDGNRTGVNGGTEVPAHNLSVDSSLQSNASYGENSPNASWKL